MNSDAPALLKYCKYKGGPESYGGSSLTKSLTKTDGRNAVDTGSWT